MAVAHEQADHVVAGLAEQPGRHAAIDASGHGKDYAGHKLIVTESGEIDNRRKRGRTSESVTVVWTSSPLTSDVRPLLVGGAYPGDFDPKYFLLRFQCR